MNRKKNIYEEASNQSTTYLTESLLNIAHLG